MKDAAGLLDDAGQIVAALTKLGLEPVLVGGMALVTLGSRRVTRDFDFVVRAPGDRLGALVQRILFQSEDRPPRRFAV